MIIPIKCFTCGNVLADKYEFYKKQVILEKLKDGQDVDDVVYLESSNIKKTVEAKVMDKLQLTKLCCRRHMLCHVDIIG